MSALVIVLAIGGSVHVAGEIMRHRERMARARADLNRPRELYTQAVVEAAIAGALAVCADYSNDQARHHAVGLCDRLDAGIVITEHGPDTVDNIDAQAATR